MSRPLSPLSTTVLLVAALTTAVGCSGLNLAGSGTSGESQVKARQPGKLDTRATASPKSDGTAITPEQEANASTKPAATATPVPGAPKPKPTDAPEGLIAQAAPGEADDTPPANFVPPGPVATPIPLKAGESVNDGFGITVADPLASNDVSALVSYDITGAFQSLEWVPKTNPALQWSVEVNTDITLSKVVVSLSALTTLRARRLLSDPIIVLETPMPWPSVDIFTPIDPTGTPTPPGATPTTGGAASKSIDLTPGDAGFPVQLKKGSTTLTFAANQPAFESFIRDRKPLERLELDITLVDSGLAVVQDGAKPTRLKGHIFLK